MHKELSSLEPIGCKWKLKKRLGSRGKKRKRDNKNVIRTNVQQDRWSSAGLVQPHSRKRKKGKMKH